MKQIKQVQFIARLHSWNDNVAQAVLRAKDQGDGVTENQLVKALENKYDALKDKLLAEVRPFGIILLYFIQIVYEETKHWFNTSCAVVVISYVAVYSSKKSPLCS